MKKNIFLSLLFFVIFILLFENKVYATNKTATPKLLYQDVTINTDGSLRVKEALWLNGDYNGANREIEFKKYNSYPFTGIYSNFSGDSDIYDATKITDIKVFDISQSNFNSIEDINNTEKEFKKVEKASNGNYGVYTITEDINTVNISIYCPAKKKKVFYIEYTLKDAVVVHNDVAELYWCFTKNNSSTTISDYKAIVHLPQADNNVMIWSHGPATGNCNIIDYKTLSLEDTNIDPYEHETLRIMFSKALVPLAEKNSNVNGKEYILKYEKAMSDPNTASIETNKMNIENRLSQIILELNETPYMSLYNSANELLEKITWDDILKKEYQEKLNNFKEAVNQNWKESIEWDYNSMIKYNSISQYRIDYLLEEIDEGFDKDAKAEYYAKVNELQEMLNKKNLDNKHTILQIVVIGYFILGVICIFKLIKLFFERKSYNKKYYRDFPSNDKAYIIDYLMNKKITTKTFLVTILDLIAEKKILLEKNSNDEDEFIFVLPKEQFSKTSVENTVIEILFNTIGKNNRCSMNELKNYGTNMSKSNALIRNFRKFERKVDEEVKRKEYFKKSDKFNNILRTVSVIFSLISIILGLFVSGNGYISVLNYYLITIILSFVNYRILSLDKGRTKKGSIEYSKWLAHKRFLKDFGRFENKDLPEIILWDRYFVTAVILGCSNQVLKQMKIRIIDYEAIDELQSMIFQYTQYQNMKTLEHTIGSLIHNAKSHSTIESPSSSSRDNVYSSGDGYGGGSSSGGSGGGGGGWSSF